MRSQKRKRSSLQRKKRRPQRQRRRCGDHSTCGGGYSELARNQIQKKEQHHIKQEEKVGKENLNVIFNRLV